MELAKLTWPDARDAIRAASLALAAVGAIEQHGRHLPLETDWLIASHIARDAARTDDRLLLPGIHVGVSAQHGQFWGTLSRTPDGLRDQAVDLARSIASHGLSRLVFVNGHGSNCAPLQDAAQRLREEGIFAFVFNWWQSIRSSLEELFPNPTAHAGSIETSIMLAVYPELVLEDRIGQAGDRTTWGNWVEGVLVGFDAIDFTEAGNVGDPRLADPEKGSQALAAACSSLDRFCRWLAEQSDDGLARRPHIL